MDKFEDLNKRLRDVFSGAQADVVLALVRYMVREGAGVVEEVTERVMVKDCEFSVRVENVLKEKGIEYLDQLGKISEREILRWNNISHLSLLEITKICQRYGVEVGRDTRPPW